MAPFVLGAGSWQQEGPAVSSDDAGSHTFITHVAVEEEEQQQQGHALPQSSPHAAAPPRGQHEAAAAGEAARGTGVPGGGAPSPPREVYVSPPRLPRSYVPCWLMQVVGSDRWLVVVRRAVVVVKHVVLALGCVWTVVD